MSLISQNAIVKDKVKKKSKRKDTEDNEPSLVQDGREGAPENEGLDIVMSKKKKRREAEQRQLQMQEEMEMKELGSFLFGTVHSPVEFAKGDGNEGELGFDGDDTALFVMDRVGGAVEEDGELQLRSVDRDDDNDKQRKPVWVDEEEEETTVNIVEVGRLRKLRREVGEDVVSGSTYISRLRAHHQKLNPGTDWANLDSKAKGYDYDTDEESSEVENGDILRTNEELVVKRGAKLLPGMLEYSQLAQANAEGSSDAVINSVHFHRNHQLLLAGGLDRRLRFFQIDGKQNKMIDAIFLEDCPISKAAFLPDGSQVIVAGRRKFFYTVDIVKGSLDKVGPLIGREERSLQTFEVSPDSRTIAFLGHEGYIMLVSSKTKELIGTLKMNGTVRSVAFPHDGQQLLSSGGDGQIYHWDLKTRTCFHKGVDEGSINGTALCTSPVGNLFAAGSVSGIVNVYNREEFLGGKRKPLKTLENLTTKVDFMKFNHDAQMLAICSRLQKKNGLKLVHIPSFTVFSNWPNKSLECPRCMDFSPASGFIACGNDSGKVMLYKLHHYQQA